METKVDFDTGIGATDFLAVAKLKDYLNNIISSILESNVKITEEENENSTSNMQSITRFCSSNDITLLFLSISSSDSDKGN